MRAIFDPYKHIVQYKGCPPIYLPTVAVIRFDVHWSLGRIWNLNCVQGSQGFAEVV